MPCDVDVAAAPVACRYSLSTDEELDFIASVARATGVIMDPVYTVSVAARAGAGAQALVTRASRRVLVRVWQGKALLGMVRAMQETPEVFKGDNVLFVHTGGLFGLFPRVSDGAALCADRAIPVRATLAHGLSPPARHPPSPFPAMW